MKDKLLTLAERFDRIVATVLLTIFCIQIVPIEGYGVSYVKVVIMALMPFIFLFRTFFVTKALFWGIIYWITCYFTAVFHDEIRFSTLGYSGLFIITFITYYGLMMKNVFSIKYFHIFLGYLIKIYCIVLILQQICILVGIYNLPIINLSNQAFLAIDKLSSLAIEPSHTARILATAMLCYMRCIELKNDGKHSIAKELFFCEHRWVSIAFLYSMLTMGSGTAFISLACLSLYFIQRKTIVYIIPLLVGLFILADSLDLKQFERAKLAAIATTTGDNDEIAKADDSASARIIPLMNTLTMDFTDPVNWLGKGTISEKERVKWWNYKSYKLSIVDQYGLLGLIPSLILLFSCIIRRFLSLEMLMFVILFNMTLGNVAYVWGAMFMFASVRHFQVQYEKGTLNGYIEK